MCERADLIILRETRRCGWHTRGAMTWGWTSKPLPQLPGDDRRSGRPGSGLENKHRTAWVVFVRSQHPGWSGPLSCPRAPASGQPFNSSTKEKHGFEAVRGNSSPPVREASDSSNAGTGPQASHWRTAMAVRSIQAVPKGRWTCRRPVKWLCAC